MPEKSQSQPQFNYVTMMVPVPLPTTSENKDEKTKSEVSVVGAFFWAVMLLLAFWFITGGYKALQ
jgi:hypothetical protein